MLLWLLFTTYHSASAQQATVWSRTPNAIAKLLPPDKFKILDSVQEEKDLRRTGYLPLRDREALFHRGKVEQVVSGFDELGKDMLVMGLRFESVKTLRKHYPMLSEAQLRQLKELLPGLERK